MTFMFDYHTAVSFINSGNELYPHIRKWHVELSIVFREISLSNSHEQQLKSYYKSIGGERCLWEIAILSIHIQWNWVKYLPGKQLTRFFPLFYWMIVFTGVSVIFNNILKIVSGIVQKCVRERVYCSFASIEWECLYGNN